MAQPILKGKDDTRALIPGGWGYWGPFWRLPTIANLATSVPLRVLDRVLNPMSQGSTSKSKFLSLMLLIKNHQI